MNAELIRYGHRLRDLDDPLETNLWVTDVIDIVMYAPEDSPVTRALNPEHEWTLGRDLQAATLDYLVLSDWAKGGKRGPKPKPIDRPSVRKESYTHTRTYTGTPTSIVDMDAWLEKRRANGY